MTISITSKARDKINQLVEQGEIATAEFRLVSGCAGCGGLAVGLSINEPMQQTDKVVTVDGIAVYIAQDSEEYIGNTIVDYSDNEYGGNFILSNEYGSSVCFID